MRIECFMFAKWVSSRGAGEGSLMTVTERTFHCSAASLFAVIADPASYPDWLVGTKEMRKISPAWPAVGSSFEHGTGFGPIKLVDQTTVLSVDPPARLELHVRARPAIEADVLFEVLADGANARLRLTETPSGVFRLLSPIAEPLIRARNERSLKRLAMYVEREPTR